MQPSTFTANNRDPKTWVLEWMIGNVHHEAKALDLIELTGMSTLGELYELGCQLHRNALESIFQKPKPRAAKVSRYCICTRIINVNGFIAHNTFFDRSKNPYSKPRISSNWF